MNSLTVTKEIPPCCYLGYACCCWNCCCCSCSCCICCWSCCCVICCCRCPPPPPKSIVKQMQLMESHSGMAQLQAQLQSPNWKQQIIKFVNKWLSGQICHPKKWTDLWLTESQRHIHRQQMIPEGITEFCMHVVHPSFPTKFIFLPNLSRQSNARFPLYMRHARRESW